MQLNPAQRELTVKVVYYGPGLSGKTTNLQKIHERTKENGRGRLLIVETRDDRTLFFDLFPLFFRTAAGFRVKVKLFTVPGQVLHNTTRKIVLQNADAVAFIADSRRDAQSDNNEYWRNLRENMRENGLNPDEIPVVIQYNKQDLPDALTDREVDAIRQRGKEPILGAVAIRCEGVLETLYEVLRLAYRKLDRGGQVSRTLGLTESEFLRQIFSQMDLHGTALERRFSEQRGVQGLRS